MANERRIIDNKVCGDHRSLAENPMVHALSCQWPFGKSKLDLNSLRRVRSNNLKLASWRAELVEIFGTNSTGSSFRNPALRGSSNISRTQHSKLLKLSQSLCHVIFLLPREGKSLTRKWRDARASLASKYSEPAHPRSRCDLRVTTEEIFVQRQIL